MLRLAPGDRASSSATPACRRADSPIDPAITRVGTTRRETTMHTPLAGRRDRSIMNTETKSTRATENELVRSLVDLGTEWAVLGLSFGTQALERSAKSIALAAKTLDTISRSLEKKVERATD